MLLIWEVRNKVKSNWQTRQKRRYPEMETAQDLESQLCHYSLCALCQITPSLRIIFPNSEISLRVFASQVVARVKWEDVSESTGSSFLPLSYCGCKLTWACPRLPLVMLPDPCPALSPPCLSVILWYFTVYRSLFSIFLSDLVFASQIMGRNWIRAAEECQCREGAWRAHHHPWCTMHMLVS